jgi:protein involved in polysaccharide export with SLBB domain
MLTRVAIVVGAICALASPALGQARDTATAIRQLQQQVQRGEITPEEILARLEAAEMTVDDLRQRLVDAGYPADLLDEYLSTGAFPAGVPALTSEQVERLLQRLSIPPLGPAVDSLYGPTRVAREILVDTLALPLELEPPVFGRSLFERATTEFVPVTMGPVPANYRLGPGDGLVLVLTGDVQAIYDLPVTREGFVVIPDVGRVSVNGLTLDQLRNALYTYLGQVYSGVRQGPEATTFFEVTIGSLRSNQVYVIGDVDRPGQYEVTSVSTALDALYRSGGPTKNGSFRNIQVRRGERVVANLDVYEYLTRGAATGDITLNQGDVVYVPVRGRHVEIAGNVMRPGIYELKGEEGLRALIDLAGGVEPEADLRRVQLDRIVPPDQRQPGVGRTLVDVNVAELLDTEGEFVPIDRGDRVYVFAVGEERRNSVTLRGNVWSPGVYAFSPGMTLGDLLDRAGGVKVDTYLGRAQIFRLDPMDLSRSVVAVPLTSDLETELMEYDEVVVYSISEFQARRTVSIDGAVNDPGVYEYRENMTVRDVILEAGGLTEAAYVLEAEVARVIMSPERPGDLTEILTVPLDSSYVVNETDGPRAGREAEFLLQPYDNVFIRSRPGFELQRKVTITGEVMFPGSYALVREGEDLTSLIERAGGLTPEAYPDGVRYFRIEQATGDPESHVSRLNVDLTELLDNPSERNRFALMDGDSIHIPGYSPTVLVDGAVLYPTSVMFEPGQGLDYYISMAGGYAFDADKGRTRVEYPNGSVGNINGWFIFKSKPVPEAGSRVFVPAKPPATQGSIDLRNLVAVLTALTTMVIVLSRN